MAAKLRRDLMDAIRNHDFEKTEVLLNFGADPNIGNPNPLLFASKYRNLPLMRLLVDAGADVNYSEPGTGITPLHEACSRNRYEVASFLIEKGANVNASEGSRYGTPLHAAATYFRKKICELLLRNGARIDSKDDLGDTPLLVVPSSREAIPTILTLLNKGADINAKNDRGVVLLHTAAGKGDPSFVRFLIDNHANINIIDDAGQSPLHYAVKMGNVKNANTLVQRGADVTIIDNYGQTARDLARTEEMKRIFPPESWQDICDILTDEYASQLKQITIQNVNEDNFDDISRTFKFTGDLSEFSDYVNSLPKRKICEYLSRYYILKKKCPSSTIDAIDRSDFEKDYQGEPLIFIEPNCYKLSNIVQWYDPGQENRRRDPVTRRPFTNEEIREILRRKI
jgi:ankyrin repeat protein